MRIGEINRENYKQFLAMLGVKSNNALDNLMGADKTQEELYPTDEEVYAKMVKLGRVEEGMLIKAGEDIGKYNRIVPVSDEIREKLILTVRRQFLENGNGLPKPDCVDSDELGAMMKEYRKNIPPSERLAVSWTLCHIVTDEQQRLRDYVKSQNPSWNLGQVFDRNILLNSDFGTKSIDVKA